MATAAQAAQRPNIIVIQTDDQDATSLRRSVMPETAKLMRRGGTKFTDYVTSGPLCCPSRAVLLTGQYGHNNGVLWNHSTAYESLRGKRNTLPVWLSRAGYRTAHVGKYVARAGNDANQVPPGWDEWHTVLDPVGYYRYVLQSNGRRTEHGAEPRDFVTNVLNRKAERLIHRYVPRHRPLFMQLDQFAPHNAPSGFRLSPRCGATALPAPGDGDLFADAPLPRPPSFNEADVSDKPGYVRAQPRLDRAMIAEHRRQHGCRLASLRAVDRGLGSIVRALRSEGELRDTAIVFTSDNGWLQGEHRVPGRKIDPYEEALHVPFALWLPERLRPRRGMPRTLATTVANVDVPPTTCVWPAPIPARTPATAAFSTDARC